MMLAGKIHYAQPWEADRLDGLPLEAAAAARWPEAGRSRRPSLTAIAGAVILHVAAAVVALAFVPTRPSTPQAEAPTVTLVFEQPEAPPVAAAEPAPPPADATPEPPPPPEAVTPPEPPQSSPEPVPPVAEQPPLHAEPPPPIPEEKLVEAPKPTAPPVAHKPVARVKPAVPPRVAVSPPSATAEAAPRAPAPAQRPPVQNSTAQTSQAEQPIAPDWERSLAAWLAAHKVYPELARRRGVEGSVGLRFTADRSGRVLNVSLLRSAGSPLLDAAAQAMVRDATLPPFPSAMPQAVATVSVTVHYGLMN